MQYLYTLDELLAADTNGWSCHDCGRTWLDIRGPSVAVPITEGDDDCPHTKLGRAMVAQG